MTLYAPGPDTRERAQIQADRDKRLHRMTADTRQLVEPITEAVRQRGRRIRTRWTAIDHPPLLASLRLAAAGQLAAPMRGPERRGIPDSATPPGWNADASTRLGDIRAGIGDWRARLNLPRHVVPVEVDLCYRCLTQLVDAGRKLDPDQLDQLARDIHRWWRWAATCSGWRPAELEALR